MPFFAGKGCIRRLLPGGGVSSTPGPWALVPAKRGPKSLTLNPQAAELASTLYLSIRDGWTVPDQGPITRFLDSDVNTSVAVLACLVCEGLVNEDDTFEVDPDDGRQRIEFVNKWYSHDQDMIKLSLKLPTVVFRLEGEGRAQGDVWESHFLNGKRKYFRPRVVWPTEDEIAAMPWGN